jgi:hypothetical protein
MLGVAILPASIQDRDGCIPVLKEVRRLFPFLQRSAISKLQFRVVVRQQSHRQAPFFATRVNRAKRSSRVTT